MPTKTSWQTAPWPSGSKACDVGIRALATHPRRSFRKGLGEKDVAVDIAGITVRPGQWIYADEDGVLVAAARLA